jgi:hypothetical protein
MGKFSCVVLFSILALIPAGCKKEGSRKMPVMTTSPAYAITDNSAVINGMVRDDFEWYASKGVCYSTIPDPLVDINPVAPQKDVYIVGADLYASTFSLKLTGLLPGVTYYAKSYTVGGWSIDKPAIWYVVYGNEISFTTTVDK